MKSTNKLLYTLCVIALVITNVSCKKKVYDIAVPQVGTVTDVENNTYKTVKIGNQWWMMENLKTQKYRNGWPIQQLSLSAPDSVWAQQTKGCCCQYGNVLGNVTTYGMLYNWYVITDTNNIAPAGWHIPTDDDWKTLEIYLGMSQADADNVKWRGKDEGDKLKIQTLGAWLPGNGYGNNSSGFSALGGSCRLFNAAWGDQGLNATGFWWSSTVHSSDNQAWYRYLDYNFSNVFRYHASKNYGMSIRCVKD